MPDKMHHIAVEVSDALSATQFFCDLLGFTKVAEHTFPERSRTIVFVQLGDVCVELLQGPDCQPYHAHAKNAGYQHLCLHTTDVDGDIERLRAAGATIISEPFDTEINSRIAFFQGPDGIPLELWQDK